MALYVIIPLRAGMCKVENLTCLSNIPLCPMICYISSLSLRGRADGSFAKCLLPKFEDLTLALPHLLKKQLGVVVHTYKSSTGKEETGESLAC